MFSGDCRGTVETQIGQTAVLGASPGCSSGASPGRCEAGFGAAGGLFQKEVSSANGAERLAGTVRCGEGTPREGAMRFPSDLPADLCYQRKCCQPFRFSLWSGLLELFAYAPGETGVSSAPGKNPKPNRLRQGDLACFSDREREYVWEARGNAARAFPCSIRGGFGQDSHFQLGRGEPPPLPAAVGLTAVLCRCED